LKTDLGTALQIIAHRGASGVAPENTLAALRAAAAAGAHGAEVDVQSTSDGVLVLVHDDTWQRTAGFLGAVAATPWDVARRLDVGSWFATSFGGEGVPTLDEVLDCGGDGFRFNLEIKSPENHRDLGPRILTAVRRHDAFERVVCTCFDPDVIEALAAAETRLQCGYLSASTVVRRHPNIRTYAIRGTALRAAPEWIRGVRAEGGQVWAWTVDGLDEAQALAREGVEAIITNRPERFCMRQ